MSALIVEIQSPWMDVSDENLNSIIADRHITARQLSLQLGIGEADMCRRVKQCSSGKTHLFGTPAHFNDSSNFWLAS
jgi:hypothetical protein